MFSAILAGGENKRFPRTKAFLEIRGRKIINSTIDTLREIFGKVVISTNEPEKFFYLGLPLIGDIYPAKGPLVGIFSVLAASLNTTGAEEVFVTGCDMPFIRRELVQTIASKRGKGAKAIVPVWNGKPEPLLAMYSAACLPEMEKSILGGKTGIQDFLSKIDVLYIDETEVKGIDPSGRSFININTPEDLEKYGDSDNGGS